MGNSARIGLPFLDAAQAQKHVTMNEALARLDMVAAARVETMALVIPLMSPMSGCWARRRNGGRRTRA